MTKIIVSLIMILSIFSSTAFAGASKSGIQNAFEELSYSLNVEWDQQDMKFYNAQKAKFSAEVKALGMTPQQLADILNEEITDVQVRKDIVSAYTVVKTKKMTESEAEAYIVEVLSHSQAEGAHWNPLSKVGSALKTAGTVALVAVLVILFSQTGAFQGATI